jgi:UrcA family protein
MQKLMFAAPFSAALALGGLPTSASAQIDEARSIRIERSDLDLRAIAGQKTFETRVNSAIAEVCPPDYAVGWAQKSCEQRARISVQAQLAEKPIIK